MDYSDLINQRLGPISGGVATKLTTARKISVDLSKDSTTDVTMFDGTADVQIGVFGILPIQNGGVGTPKTTGTGANVFNYSPEFTGVPITPTAAKGDSSSQIANVEFVNTSLNSILGPGQSIADLTSTNKLGVTYYNTTSRPIIIFVTVYISQSTAGTQYPVNASVSDEFVNTVCQIGPNHAGLTFIVPPGNSYSVGTPAVGMYSLVSWREFR